MPAQRAATSRRSSDLRPRKRPQQERSRRTNEVILEGAVRVLRRRGAIGFTTARVAEAAGISVGSLYQYYPNKAALLFRLQARETAETWGEVEAILGEVETPPRERVVRAVDRFFETEAAEAELRRALQDAAVFAVTMVSATAEEVTNRGASRRELRKWSRTCSAMLCDHFGL
jgi:AcrR family transcriptional regulator